MALSTRALFLAVGTASFQWKSGHVVDAMTLSEFPTYCAKDMSVFAIPSLAESVSSTFGSSVSEDDVELLQVSVVCRDQQQFGNGRGLFYVLLFFSMIIRTAVVRVGIKPQKPRHVLSISALVLEYSSIPQYDDLRMTVRVG